MVLSQHTHNFLSEAQNEYATDFHLMFSISAQQILLCARNCLLKLLFLQRSLPLICLGKDVLPVQDIGKSRM